VSIHSAADASSLADHSDGAPGSGTATGAGEADDCVANAIEVRHQVALETVGPDVAVFTVTRELAARTPMRLVCLSHLMPLPGQSVVDSFSIQTDGTWRKARLRPDPRFEEHPVEPPAADAPDDRPCASLRWQPSGAYLEMPGFHPRGHIAIRYTLWAQGELQRGGRRWSYCATPLAGSGSGMDQPPVVPEVVKVPDDASVVVGADPESTDCLIIEKRVPPPPTLSARFGAYRTDSGWLWRLELAAPAVLATDWRLPESAPVVLVLDASRSVRRYGGIQPQIAVVRAYLANTPNARVELILVGRTAERVFGHLASPTELDDASAGRVAATALGNGSFLDRGLELAADVLREAGTPGRVIFMSDGELRSRFNRSAAIATLKRAPRGTVVHWLFPEVYKGTSVDHRAPGQIGDLVEVPIALGGAAYVVTVSDPSGAELVPLLGRLVSPDRLESLEMRDASSGAAWPVWPDDGVRGQIVAGDRVAWSGVSTRPPPARLAIAGWLWGKRVELGVAADAGLQRILPRVATSDSNLMDCVSSDRHAKRALAEGFLAPGLELRVPGSGDIENVGVAGGDGSNCGPPVVHGGGRVVAPAPSDLPHGIFVALEACHLLEAENAAIRVKLETYGDEIVDVAVQGASTEERRCAEEALWATALPEDFNGRMPWVRKDYTLGLSVNPHK
jgi:hypothetical protein